MINNTHEVRNNHKEHTVNVIATTFTAIQSRDVENLAVAELSPGRWALTGKDFRIEAEGNRCGCHFDVDVTYGGWTERLIGRNALQLGMLAEDHALGCSVI